MKIYTKTGDSGETGLLGGMRVGKDHLAIEVCGTLDELNSIIGLARSQSLGPEFDKLLGEMQNHLFDLGSRVAGCLSETNKVGEFPETRSADLEQRIDQFQDLLPPLTAFILPAGHIASCYMHMARAVCRRAERRLVGLLQMQLNRDLNPELIYLNRLSDFLFVAARLVNLQTDVSEVNWQPSN